MTRDTIQLIFPQGKIGYLEDHSFEVNALPAGTIPQNCAILGQTDRKDRYGQRYWLVTTNDYAIFLRICDADENSEYDEFAVGHRWIKREDEGFNQFLVDTLRKIGHLQSVY